MREHLTFLLAGPMGSFGSYAGHERRGSESVPLRSAILGLVGAALGVKRVDKKDQEALRAYSVAVQSLKPSTPLRDYHTVQTISSKFKRPATRLHAFQSAGRDVNTVITIRDYRCDILIGATLWGKGRWKLSELEHCLKFPTFPLYLGRRSCPLSCPLNPKVLEAKGPVEALAQIEIPEWLHHEKSQGKYTVYSDPIENYALPPHLIEKMPGEPLDRCTWTFAEQTVWRIRASNHDSPEGED